MNHVWLTASAAWLVLPGILWSAPETNRTGFFLPQNPVAAAYVLGRLSNRELIEAPRSEFVDVALLQRKGLDRKYRIEALDGLADLRHTDRFAELLRGMVDLDQKGGDSADTIRELASILLQTDRPKMVAHRPQLAALTQKGQLPVTRQAGFAALITADRSPEPTWSSAQPNPASLTDLLSSIPLIAESTLRAEFYAKVAPLVLAGDKTPVLGAAITAIVAIPGHEAETFGLLTKLVEAGVQVQTAVIGLSQIPRSAWRKDSIPALSQSLVNFLQTVPSGERTEVPFATVLQFAAELASLLSPEAQRALVLTLRTLGPTIVTLHAIYEQMRFDQELILLEAAKPAVLVLQNDDAMPHNLALLAPGTLQEIGQAAEKMPPEPDSEGRLYVPASAKVLHATRLVNPGQQARLVFDAPATAGDYPFACTFPGHWLRMSGTLRVVSDLDAYLVKHPPSEQPKLTEWKMADFLNELPPAGEGRDLAAGRRLFSKLACSQCHRLGADGYAFGPELTDVFKRYKNDRGSVLLQILEPSRNIEDRYRNFNLEFKDGDSVVGIILKEDEQSVTIQSGPAESLIQVLSKSQIQQRRPMPSSPMPTGLLNQLTKDEIFDLLAYVEAGGAGPQPEHHH